MKRVLVLNPPRVDGKPVVREERFEHKDFESVYPPLILLYCAGQIRDRLGDRVEVSFLDAMGYDLSPDTVMARVAEIEPDIVVSRFAFDTYREDLELLAAIKAAHPKVVTLTRNKIVGDVPWLMERYLREFDGMDYFVTVEQDSAIAEAVEDLLDGKDPRACAFVRNGEIIRTTPVPAIDDLDQMALPAYDLLPKPWPYKSSLFPENFTLVMSSRGCPYLCTFCAYRKMDWRARSPEHVVNELELLQREHGVKNVVFFDDTVSMDKARCLEICRLMKARGLDLKFAVCTRINTVDQELIRAWKEVGLQQLTFGIESGSPAILKTIKKGLKKKQIVDVCKMVKDEGVQLLMLFIFGLPGENRETIADTVEMVKEIDPFYLQFSALVPFPNTPLYQQFKDKGWLAHEDFSRYNPLDIQPIIRTEDMDHTALGLEIKAAYRRYMFRPKFVLDRVSLTDWAWNWRGFKMFARRAYGFVVSRYVR